MKTTILPTQSERNAQPGASSESIPAHWVALEQNSQAQTGRNYWRSLEELEGTPEFREWVEREFPAGASELSDPVNRRHFMKLMSASFMLAGIGLGTSGCRRPVQNLEPFGKMPENYVHGVPQFFATAMPTQTGAVPLVAKSSDGRPTKLEGNGLLNPDKKSGTDCYAQASILNLYDPDRTRQFAYKGNNTTAEKALEFLGELGKNAEKNQGQGLAFLIERGTSPSRLRLQKIISDKLPQARWFVHDPVDLDIHRRAATAAFGKSLKPFYAFDEADIIVSLDSDFIGSEDDATSNIVGFAKRRQVEKTDDKLNRLYVAESLMTITGFNADHRLRVPSSQVAQVAAGLANQIGKTGISCLENLAQAQGLDAKWIAECARDLAANPGRSLVLAGHRQPMAVHLLANAMNAALGNVGKTVLLLETPPSKEGTIADLAQALTGNQVSTLVILGGNPAYTAPADVDFARAVRKNDKITVVRLGYYEDETFPISDWHLPAAHYLESWGDALTADGTLVPVQPLIAPLFGGLTELEVLARIAGQKITDPYAIVRETFAGTLKGADAEAAWRKFLHDGFLANSAPKGVQARIDTAAIGKALGEIKVATPSKDKLEVVFHRDYKLDDGRFNNNGWMQELPDPVTKITWDNVILISRKTSEDLGVTNRELVTLELNGASVTGPIWVQPGQADNSVGVALGYGRTKPGRVGNKVGFNVYPLRKAAAANFATGATIRGTGKSYKISCTQNHWSLEGRNIVRETNLEEFRKKPDFAKHMVEKEPEGAGPLYPNPLDDLKKKGLHQWGMSIDLNKCVGCSACVLACQSENNIPIVGKEMVGRGREMHWLRIDRYYAGPGKMTHFPRENSEDKKTFESWIDNPQTVMQPMLCQHCEAAPCENVCPVNATSHDQEGLNVMTYNRCVGTRYCSNNCPYKVRRFNFFDYNKRPIDKLKLGPFATRRDDEWDLLKMSKNPDVTVRMRGVMEKCTFCLQRIEQAKIAQKTKAGASGDVIVPTDSFTTACAQACPADAIVFGNIKDPDSRVSKLKQLERDYSVLEFLLTKPRLTYLARVRNPNPAMPDYQAEPYTFQDYENRERKSGGEEPETPSHEKNGKKGEA